MNILRFLGYTTSESARVEGREVVLSGNRILRLAGAKGRRIICISGCAWVTTPGVLDDIFLLAGDAWEIASDGRVLIEAVGSATISLAALA